MHSFGVFLVVVVVVFTVLMYAGRNEPTTHGQSILTLVSIGVSVVAGLIALVINLILT